MLRGLGWRRAIGEAGSQSWYRLGARPPSRAPPDSRGPCKAGTRKKTADRAVLDPRRLHPCTAERLLHARLCEGPGTV